jgi:hydrogen peroxide-dependent heme synthase
MNKTEKTGRASDRQVPETLEGWSVLHQMFRLRWPALVPLTGAAIREIAEDAAGAVMVGEEGAGATAPVQLLGHKGDLMFLHFRRSLDGLAAVQLALARTRLNEFLEQTTSYVSMVELGMYDMTAKLHQQLTTQGLAESSEEFERAARSEWETQRARLAGRLFPAIPARRYVCFYPMNKRRGESFNWYSEPFDERASMMREHGMIGRRYSGAVTQIISGSIGYDDWEWGVDLFADEALVFKKLIYEMRFDRASAVYAEFGPFYVGLQFGLGSLGRFLNGETPPL